MNRPTENITLYSDSEQYATSTENIILYTDSEQYATSVRSLRNRGSTYLLRCKIYTHT